MDGPVRPLAKREEEIGMALSSSPSPSLKAEESKAPTIKSLAEESKSEVTNTKPKPSLETLISFQLSEGKWSTDCEGILRDFFTDSNIQDAAIDAVLA